MKRTKFFIPVYCLTLVLIQWTVPVTAQTGPGGVGQRDVQDKLVLWLKAGEGITTNAQNQVTNWADQSGYSNDAGSTSMPDFTASAINNRPAVTFDGQYDNMTITGDASLQPSYITIFAVAKRDHITGWGDIISRPYYDYNHWESPYTSYTLNSCSSHFGSSTDRPFGQVAVNGAQIANWDPPHDSVPDHEAYIHALVYDGTGMGSYIDNERIPGWSAWIAAAGTLDYNGNNANISIGHNSPYISGPFADHYFAGDIAEIIIYNEALNNAEHVIVVNALSVKYNILIGYDKYAEQTGFTEDVIGIGKESDGNHLVSQRGGMKLQCSAFPSDGSYIFAAHNSGSLSGTTVNIPSGYNNRIERIWYVASTGTKPTTSQIAFVLPYNPGGTLTDYGLLFSTNSDMSSASEIATASSIDITGKTITFSVSDAQLSDGYYTLGSKFNHWTALTGSEWSEASNWEKNMTPDGTDNVKIISQPLSANYPVINSGITEHTDNLTIESGASLTINANNSLTVDGTLTNNAGVSGIQILSDATGSGSLIHQNSGVDATVKRFLPDNAWHFITPVTTNVTVEDFYWHDTPKCWIIYHDETDNSFDNYILDIHQALNRGQGYAIWLDGATRSDTSATMTGTLLASDLTLSLQYSGNGDNEGWNFIGNPFPCAIDRDLGTWGSNFTGAVYVWDNDYDADGEYLTYTPGTGGTLTDGIIPMGQGFFVKALNNGDITVPAAARVHNSTNFYKMAESNAKRRNVVSFKLETSGYKSVVLLGLLDNATMNFDVNMDADRLPAGATSPQLSIIENGRFLCINASPPLKDDELRIVQLNIDHFINGDYTLTLENGDNLPDVNIILEDTKTGTYFNIKKDSVYRFSAQPDENTKRFKLRLSLHGTGIKTGEKPDNSPFKIFAKGKSIIISTKDANFNSKPCNLFVTTLTGKILFYQPEFVLSSAKRIPINSCNTVVLVRLETETGIYSKKVVIH